MEIATTEEKTGKIEEVEKENVGEIIWEEDSNGNSDGKSDDGSEAEIGKEDVDGNEVEYEESDEENVNGNEVEYEEENDEGKSSGEISSDEEEIKGGIGRVYLNEKEGTAWKRNDTFIEDAREYFKGKCLEGIPGIVEFQELSVEKGIKMKYYPHDIVSAMNEVSFSPLEKLHITKKILEIIYLIHARGFVHGDIKLHNFLINRIEENKLEKRFEIVLCDLLSVCFNGYGDPYCTTDYCSENHLYSLNPLCNLSFESDLFSLGILIRDLWLDDINLFRMKEISDQLIQKDRKGRPSVKRIIRMLNLNFPDFILPKTGSYLRMDCKREDISGYCKDIVDRCLGCVGNEEYNEGVVDIIISFFGFYKESNVDPRKMIDITNTSKLHHFLINEAYSNY